MIMDYGRDWFHKTYEPYDVKTITAKDYYIWVQSFQKLVKEAETYDRVTGQPDCVDPEKAELMQKITDLEARIKELE